jgi:hypothetical protein
VALAQVEVSRIWGDREGLFIQAKEREIHALWIRYGRWAVRTGREYCMGTNWVHLARQSSSVGVWVNGDGQRVGSCKWHGARGCLPRASADARAARAFLCGGGLEPQGFQNLNALRERLLGTPRDGGSIRP